MSSWESTDTRVIWSLLSCCSLPRSSTTRRMTRPTSCPSCTASPTMWWRMRGEQISQWVQLFANSAVSIWWSGFLSSSNALSYVSLQAVRNKYSSDKLMKSVVHRLNWDILWPGQFNWVRELDTPCFFFSHTCIFWTTLHLILSSLSFLSILHVLYISCVCIRDVHQ